LTVAAATAWSPTLKASCPWRASPLYGSIAGSYGNRRTTQEPAMYVFHSTINVKPGCEAEWESGYQPGSHPILKAPGFLRRMKLKDKENPGRYFYISVWETFEHLQAYRATDNVKAHVKDLSGRNLFSSPIERVECELVGGLLE
jgi:heme-degrading monooxygenase HmoA